MTPERQDRYLISRHSRKGIEWFSIGEINLDSDWSAEINSDTIGFTDMHSAKYLVKALRERPENQYKDMSIRIAKWEGDHFNFWEVRP